MDARAAIQAASKVPLLAHPQPRLTPPTIVGDITWIPLTQGRFAIIDTVDFERVAAHSWSLKRNTQDVFYAKATINGKTVMLHRFIMNATADYPDIDHANLDGLDNRRCNLRFCTNGQNQQNRRGMSKNPAGFKGVTYRRHRNKYQARIRIEGQLKHLGNFSTAEAAAMVYDKAAAEHHGKFARTNA
jgi:hypothetical protein